MTDEIVETKRLTINFDQISALAGVGVRRASAFLKMGLVACEQFDDKFQKDTNVARKLAAVAASLAIKVEIESFQSLSLARNALTHAAGVVRERDANQPTGLEISRVAPVMIILDGDKEIVFRSEPADMHRVESKEGAQVVLRFDRHATSFAVGQRIRLSPHNLAEICAFYDIAAAKVIEGLKTAMRAKGILQDTHAAA